MYDFPFEQAAMRGDAMPGGLDLYEQAAYQALRYLYAEYYAKHIDRESAHDEKMSIKSTYLRQKSAAEFADKLAKHQADVNNRTAYAKHICNQDPSPENVRMLINVLDGLDERKKE